CRECFRRYNEEGFSRIEVPDGFDEIGAIHVGNESERQSTFAVMFQCFVGHHRSEVGSTNPNVDDVANALPGVPLPLTAPEAIGEVCHFVQHSVDLRYNLLALNYDGCSLGSAQRYVEHRPLLGYVDLLPSKHRIDARPQS